MRKLSLCHALIISLLLLTLSGCGAADPPPAAAPDTGNTAVDNTAVDNTAANEGVVNVSDPLPVPTVDFESDLADFASAVFDRPTEITNIWMPLRPGTQLVFEGVTEESGREVPHQIISTVTDLTKVIDGVRTVVLWDRDISAGELVEAELAFFAQDNDGNVWHLGQYPEVYERGQLVEAPAWISGLKGARAGIFMTAVPELDLGQPSYSQGWGPAVNWTDRAQVAAMGQQLCVPYACYDDVLLVEEFSREEPGAFQLKYYAPNVGNVAVGWKGADATRETLELVDFIQLDAAGLAEAREEALKLEKRAYEISLEVYDQTSPAE